MGPLDVRLGHYDGVWSLVVEAQAFKDG